MRSLLTCVFTIILGLAGCTQRGDADPEATSAAASGPGERKSFQVCWSRYPGWEPWGLAQSSGVMRRWADRFGIDVELVYVDDYADSVKQYRTGRFSGCAMTNIEALQVATDVATTVAIIGDYSMGSDGIVSTVGEAVESLRDSAIDLVSGSVSHFVLYRAAQISGLQFTELEINDVSENDIVRRIADGTARAAATWNPHLAEARLLPEVRTVFSTAEIPGEILDLMVIRSDAPPELGHALAGAWYEIMRALASDSNPERDAAITAIAMQMGVESHEFLGQLETTAMFYAAWDATGFSRSAQMVEAMEQARRFMSTVAPGSQNTVSVEYPNGRVSGNPADSRLRVVDTYMNAVSLDLTPTRGEGR